MIPPVPHIAAMAPYALADLSAPEGLPLVSLSQNECLRGPSPASVRAIAEAAEQAQLYPDPDWSALREAIGGLHELDPGQIVCGNGSLDLIGCIARAYCNAANAVLAAAHAYPFFRTATAMTGARFDTAHEADLAVDVDALLAAIRDDTRVVLIANPGNPTGTRIPRTELLRLRDGLPDDVLLVIDEAYGEFADHLDESMFDLVARGDTVVLRTFSKAYGLAGMRVGWGLFPSAVAGEIRKLLNPNNISAPGQAAARAAMIDQAYMRGTCRQTADIRDNFAARIRAMGLFVPPSHTNFVLLRFPSAIAAAQAEASLRSKGVLLRAQGGAGLPDCLRATVGRQRDMEKAAGLLELCIKEGGHA